MNIIVKVICSQCVCLYVHVCKCNSLKPNRICTTDMNTVNAIKLQERSGKSANLPHYPNTKNSIYKLTPPRFV